MTKLEIIKETADYYSENPSKRGLNIITDSLGNKHPGQYVYITEDGKMCAVGRACINPIDFQYSVGGQGLETLYGEEDNFNLDPELKPEYRGHTPEFWMDLQDFHDISKNWDEKGLTEIGHIHLNQLLEKYGE